MTTAVGPFVGPQTRPRKEQTHQAHSCGSNAPMPERHGVRRARPRRKGLGERLSHIRNVVSCLPVSEPEYAYKPVRIRPVLDAWVVPEGCGGGAAPLGLSIQPNSQSRARPGMSGISNGGRRFLKDSLLLMEDFRERLCMWTITLPDEDYPVLVKSGSWPVFQRRCIDLMCRYLRDHGVDAVAVAAVEIGDKRTSRTKRPMPHIHMVVNGWGIRHPRGGWLLSPDRCDELVAKAAQYAGLPSRPRSAASNVAPIRKSVHNYVSKYLTKQRGVDEVDLSEGWDELIPRQWWNASDEARALVDGALFKLSAGFAAFLVRKQVELERAGLGRASAVRVGERHSMTRGVVGIELTRFRFASTDALLTAIEWYCLWVLDEKVPIGAGPPCVP